MKKKPPIPDNFTEEYIAVGGIEEYTLHYTAAPELPVLLWVWPAVYFPMRRALAPLRLISPM